MPNPGQAFDIMRIRVEPIHAIHGNQEFTVLTREPDFIDKIRFNCGYVLAMLGNPATSYVILAEDRTKLPQIAPS